MATSESSTYDANDHRISSTDRAGRVTTYTYDTLGRLTKTTYPDGTTASSEYDAIGQTTRAIDALGNVTQYGYDAARRRTSSTDPAGHVTSFAYDAAGNQISMTDSLGHITRYGYDAANCKVQTTYPDLTTSFIGYDPLSRPVSRIDQAGKKTQLAFDALSRIVSITDALGQVTRYTYDEVGSRITQKDANGHITSFAYDQRGRRVSRTLPLGQVETFGYDAVGNVTSKTDFNGRTTTYTYDNMNQMTAKTADPFFAANGLGATQVTYSYTPTSQRASMSDASGTTNYTYDDRDRLLKKASSLGTISYSYDADGRQLSITSSNPGGASASYGYDTLSRLSSVTDVSGVTSYNYDAVGNLTGYTYPNGTATTYSYNTLNRLTAMQTSCSSGTGCGAPATQLASYSYTLGASGNRLSVNELGGRVVNYGYDSLYRLVSETIAGAGAQNGTVGYTYDAAGNRLQLSSTLNAIPSGLTNYDANDRISQQPYDANGNTLNDGSLNQYDFEDHLVQRGAVTIQYDGDGNRVAETVGGATTSYLVDTNNPTGYAQVLEELQNGSVTRVYTYGLELMNQRQVFGGALQTSFYGYDGHGSVRFLTDSTGAVTDKYDYDAFGNLISQTGSTPNNYLYSGEQFDPALGLYYNRARYLNTSSGRFLTVDPYLGNLDDPLSLHRYIYARLDPVNRQDPSGRQFTAAEVSVSISVDETLETLEGAYYKNLIKFTVSAARCIYCLINPGYKLQGEAIDLLFNSDAAAEAQEVWERGQEMIVKGYEALGEAAGEALAGTVLDTALERLADRIKITEEYFLLHRTADEVLFITGRSTTVISKLGPEVLIKLKRVYEILGKSKQLVERIQKG